MKKNVICLILALYLVFNLPTMAHCSHNVYVTHRDYYEEEINFPNCEKHYAIKEVNIYYYSNGTRRNYITYSLYNDDGTIIENNCKDINHIIKDGKHYFTFYKNRKYNIMPENEKITSTKEYKEMIEIENGKLLVKLNKRYGIIDLKENIIVPIKYQKFEKINHNIFLSKLNGYWGIVDSANKILVKNEYDKISSIQNCYLLKKYGQFGLANEFGEIILNANNDKIKKLGEYILVKNKDGKTIYNSKGEKISNKTYRDIRLNRNSLEGYINKNWESIEYTGL